MYNAEQYIEKTLCSILSQTKQDFQLLIVDDCSTDNSVECVEHFFSRTSSAVCTQAIE
ncbi:MAG: glycosyltransferase family 2 protein [Bacteroides cellulosilyticus]